MICDYAVKFEKIIIEFYMINLHIDLILSYYSKFLLEIASKIF
jgi:hypothetical protein